MLRDLPKSTVLRRKSESKTTLIVTIRSLNLIYHIGVIVGMEQASIAKPKSQKARARYIQAIKARDAVMDADPAKVEYETHMARMDAVCKEAKDAKAAYIRAMTAEVQETGDRLDWGAIRNWQVDQIWSAKAEAKA